MWKSNSNCISSILSNQISFNINTLICVWTTYHNKQSYIRYSIFTWSPQGSSQSMKHWLDRDSSIFSILYTYKLKVRWNCVYRVYGTYTCPISYQYWIFFFFIFECFSSTNSLHNHSIYNWVERNGAEGRRYNAMLHTPWKFDFFFFSKRHTQQFDGYWNEVNRFHILRPERNKSKINLKSIYLYDFISYKFIFYQSDIKGFEQVYTLDTVFSVVPRYWSWTACCNHSLMLKIVRKIINSYIYLSQHQRKQIHQTQLGIGFLKAVQRKKIHGAHTPNGFVYRTTIFGFGVSI